MVRQMVGDEVPLAFCGGNPDGGLGTNVEAIMDAIDAPGRKRASRSSSISAGPRPTARWRSRCWRAGAQQVVVCNAPIVEGAVMAATEAVRRRSLEQVKAVAEELVCRLMSRPDDDWTGYAGNFRERGRSRVTAVHAVGLHARPRSSSPSSPRRFQAQVDRASPTTGRGSMPRASSR